MTDRNEKGTVAAVPLPFEIRFGGHLWKVEPTTYNGNPRLSIWPHYATFDGTTKPGRGGLQIPFDDLAAFIEAVIESARRLGLKVF